MVTWRRLIWVKKVTFSDREYTWNVEPVGLSGSYMLGGEEEENWECLLRWVVENGGNVKGEIESYALCLLSLRCRLEIQMRTSSRSNLMLESRSGWWRGQWQKFRSFHFIGDIWRKLMWMVQPGEWVSVHPIIYWSGTKQQEGAAREARATSRKGWCSRNAKKSIFQKEEKIKKEEVYQKVKNQWR